MMKRYVHQRLAGVLDRTLNSVVGVLKHDFKRMLNLVLPQRLRDSLAYRRFRHRLNLAIESGRGRSRPERMVFVVATARAGSSLLVNYLNHIPGVFLQDEVLNPRLPRGLRAEFISKRTVLRHIDHSVQTRTALVGGAKFLFGQLYVHGVSLDDLHKKFPHATFIIVYRRTLAEQFVSQRIAAKTQEWRWRAENDGFDGSLRFDVDEFRRFTKLIRHYYSTVSIHPWLHGSSLFISYEDLARDPRRVFEESIFPVLGIPPMDVVTDMKKQNVRSLEDVIVNFEEVAHVLAGEEARLELEPQELGSDTRTRRERNGHHT